MFKEDSRMNRSFFTAAIVVALASVALRAAPVPVGAKPVPEVHPLKDARVGDYATYNMTFRIKDQFIYGSMSQTITAKTDKDITIETALSINGTPTSSSCSKHKIDFAKPFEPMGQHSAPEVGTRFAKGKTGTEKLDLAGKEYEADWASYRVTRKNHIREYEQALTIWRSKTLPGFYFKLEVNCLDGQVATYELTESGRKK